MAPKKLLESGMFSYGPNGPGPHRRLTGRRLWYFQHGDFKATKADGFEMAEIGSP